MKHGRKAARPQRYAQMWVLCDDLLKGRPDIDLFDGPMLVSEVACLTASLSEIAQLGPDAEQKLKSLSTENAGEVVSSIVFELLGGGGVCQQRSFG